MEFENLSEIIAYILKKLDGKGNPDEAKKKFDLNGEEYKDILEVLKLDEYIECDEIFMDGAPNLDYASITRKGYLLMSKILISTYLSCTPKVRF